MYALGSILYGTKSPTIRGAMDVLGTSLLYAILSILPTGLCLFLLGAERLRSILFCSSLIGSLNVLLIGSISLSTTL